MEAGRGGKQAGRNGRRTIPPGLGGPGFAIMMRMRETGGAWWGRAAAAVQKDLRAWLLFVGGLGIFRVLLMAVFHGRMGPHATPWQVVLTLLNGFRFDAQAATFFCVVPLAASLLGLTRTAGILRALALGLFTVLFIVLGIVDLGFFREYDDQFNHFILGVVTDDFRAILATIGKAYPLPMIVLGAVLASACLIWLGWRWARRPWRGPEALSGLSLPGRAALVLVLSALIIVSARGSIHKRPLQLKDAAVTADPFLNKCVPNPLRALHFAIQDRRRLAGPEGIKRFIPGADLRAALARLGFSSSAADLDEALARTAGGLSHPPPRHLFLVLIEGYSGWPFFEPYRALGLTPEMDRLGGEGVLLRHFLPEGTGTMETVAALLTGLAEPGVFVNYQVAARNPFPTSVAPIFRRLGYRTRLYYGGFLSWQRIGDFAREQGIEEVYGGGDMGAWSETNEWGVRDERVFDFVLRTLPAEEPSFNIILTVSNHPPFDIDVFGLGFPLRRMPAPLVPLWDGAASIQELGHYWYADRCLGRFVEGLRERVPGALVAATADHVNHRFLNTRPGIAERAFVPLLVWGGGLEGRATAGDRLFGGQLDLLPTLVEQCAPAGFRYAALGGDLLDGGERAAAFGGGMAVGEGFVADLGLSLNWVPWPGAAPPSTPPDVKALKRRMNDYKGISWWRVMKGRALPDAAGPVGTP